MDPQRLLALDKRLIGTVRLCGLAVSLAVALLCVLVYRQIIILPESYYGWACLPTAGALVLLGLALAFWDPYTLHKVRFYTGAYVVLGLAASVLVVGFSSFTFLCWLLLLTTIGFYLHVRGVAACYGVMLASLVAWIWLHDDLWNRNSLLTLGGSALVVGAVLAVMVAVWHLTSTTIRDLDASHAVQNFEHGQLTSLINSMADGVVAVDEQANVVLYNAAALNVLDLNSSMQGASIGQFLHVVTKDNASIDVVNLVMNTRTPTTNRDLRISYKDGSFANLYLAIAPVHLGYGITGKQGFVLLLRDITHEKSLEEERDEFISVISHELRTPIAISEGNISNAQLIADKSGEPREIKKALDEAHNQTIFLADMINDLATLSRAERGKLTMEIETINVPQFMKELADNYTFDAQKKGLKLLDETDANTGELHSGKLYVREVLQNFITNALKYTEEGTVSMRAQAQHDGILFTVSDTGIGISKADQARVFNKFFRSEDYRTRQHNGTGLGLYVTMKLAKLIHATINLESELNKGATFTIFMPNLDDKTPAKGDAMVPAAAAGAESRA